MISAKMSASLAEKFDNKIKAEGRIKKITIVRLLKAYIEMKYADVLAEEE